MLASFTGCTTFENFKTGFIEKPQDKKATIQIGVYQPMTGIDSEAAEQEIKGIELAHEMYPTVNGKIVELVYADNRSDIYAAETAIKEVLVKEPLVILGSYGSVYSMVAGDYIRSEKVPAIAITNTNPLVTRNNEYYYRVCYVDSNQGDILAKYLLEQKKEKTAGVLTAGTHGSTFGGNPIAAAGALYVINSLTDELLADVTKKSEYIFSALEGKAGIKSVSGMGLMIGIETEKDAGEVIAKCIENGVIPLKAKNKVRLLPALNIPMKLLEKAVAVILEAAV